MTLAIFITPYDLDGYAARHFVLNGISSIHAIEHIDGPEKAIDILRRCSFVGYFCEC